VPAFDPKPIIINGESMQLKKLLIAVDFDGTCVTHDYPRIGKDIGAVPVLQKLAKYNTLVLHTMRGDKQGDLGEAIKWFSDNGIPLYCVNKSPGQDEWTKSPKVFAHLYIDDMALGCPLKTDFNLSPRPFVDWERVEHMLYQIGVLNEGFSA
jgi:hypothetical protein